MWKDPGDGYARIIDIRLNFTLSVYLCEPCGESPKIFYHNGHRKPCFDENPLAAESADYIQHKREDHAQQNGSGEWKIECRVLAAVEDVAGQAADGQMSASEQDERETGDH